MKMKFALLALTVVLTSAASSNAKAEDYTKPNRGTIDLSADRIDCRSGDWRNVYITMKRSEPIFISYKKIDWAIADVREGYFTHATNDCKQDGFYLNCAEVGLTIDLRTGAAKKTWIVIPTTDLSCQSYNDPYHAM